MNDSNDSRSGFYYAFSAYLIWGLLPLYWKLSENLDPVEVTAHRALWALPVAAFACWAIGRTSDIVPTLKSPRKLGILFVCTLLISVNWGVFIWAIAVERVLETALAYYINPLLSVLLGFVFLGDRFTRLQFAAISLAVCAVVLLTVLGGVFPWLSLLLAATFGLYGLLRKTVDVGPTQGFFVEILLAFPLVAGIVLWKVWEGSSALLVGPYEFWLMVFAGPATAIPLILYASGAKRLRLSTIGLMQFMVPTMLFVTSIFVFGEELKQEYLFAFVLIWSALILYAWSIIKGERKSTSSPNEKRAA